jgi:hypothetical protein
MYGNFKLCRKKRKMAEGHKSHKGIFNNAYILNEWNFGLNDQRHRIESELDMEDRND